METQLFVLGVLAVGAFVVFTDAAKSTNIQRWERVDVDAILKNDRLINNYFKCLMDKGPCSPEGTELKKALPGALQTNCAKCPAAVRRGAEKVARFMYTHRRQQWDAVAAKYDPQGVYAKKYAGELAKLKG